jgi:hypothetical protein
VTETGRVAIFWDDGEDGLTFVDTPSPFYIA